MRSLSYSSSFPDIRASLVRTRENDLLDEGSAEKYLYTRVIIIFEY